MRLFEATQVKLRTIKLTKQREIARYAWVHPDE
jgi:hypothetical protein